MKRFLFQFRSFSPLLVAAIALSCIVSSHTAHAAPLTQAITLSPASTELSIAPGQSATKSFDIINAGSDSFNFNTSVAPYSVKGETYDPRFTQLPNTTNVTSWVHISKASGVVQSNKLTTIEYTVSVPKNTAPGGYYAVLFAQTSPTTSSNGVIAHNRVGNILYITVQGTVRKSGSVVADSLSHFVVSDTLKIGMKVSNTGGVHFLTHTTVTVTGITGKKVFSASQDHYVLPQTQRDIVVSWSPSSLMNIYTVHRTATVAGVEKTLPQQWVVSVQPRALLFVVLIVVLIIAFVLLRRGFIKSRKDSRR